MMLKHRGLLSYRNCEYFMEEIMFVYELFQFKNLNQLGFFFVNQLISSSL